ncbi:DUF4256 domain-containing protein [Pseudoduganella ginsengisoli]|uniref:DUF4256 family protein n=1 Tax=Pseudoduganella ginsengisoli TaxID=1462440 RepID=A0A6L6PWL8_9BURK|nr:DUF4256 domain-containing protein [Pseudoduganella ginsengisoli]MTW01927.1 DUF4256 family protein [Pseudoduganella ginsengisoli]
MGIAILAEDQYCALQQLGQFDRKTSRWIQTPSTIRKLGGALFCDRSYDHVFTYHNDAEFCYAARGFAHSSRFEANEDTSPGNCSTGRSIQRCCQRYPNRRPSARGN